MNSRTRIIFTVKNYDKIGRQLNDVLFEKPEQQIPQNDLSSYNFAWSLKFTMEEEHFNSLRFLNVSTLRGDSKFISSINHEDTSTDQYIPFASICPI